MGTSGYATTPGISWVVPLYLFVPKNNIYKRHTPMRIGVFFGGYTWVHGYKPQISAVLRCTHCGFGWVQMGTNRS